jgi:hypothetical protein
MILTKNSGGRDEMFGHTWMKEVQIVLLTMRFQNQTLLPPFAYNRREVYASYRGMCFPHQQR